MPDCILTSLIDESVITYTQLSGVHGVDTQSHVLPTIQSQFSNINLSFVSQQATASQVIYDMMRQLSFDKTELDGDAGFADVARSGVDSSRLSHDDSFGVDDLDLNLNEPVNLNVSQVETQSELHVSEEPDVGPAQEPILAVVSTQEPIVAEVSTQEPIVAKFWEDGEDAEQGNGQEDESARTDGEFFYDDEGIDTAYETEYDVQSSEDAGTNDDDDVDEYFLVDEENEIVEPDVDVHLFGISMDLPFDNIGITNLASDDVLEGEDVDVINADGFDSDPRNDEERNYRKRRLSELRTEIEGVINASGTGPTGPNRGMEAGPSGSSGPTTRSKKKKNTGTNDDSQASPSFLDAHDKGDLCPWVLVNPDIPVKAVQDQLQRELEVQISMSKAFRAKAKAEREIRGDHLKDNDPSCLPRVFRDLRLFWLLGALKLGFRACRRDLLGLDGAFMKGPFPGQVLVAVGLDSNNGIYPLAYALVEAESKSSWCWFLQCLGDDIDLHPNSNFTFINDRKKGYHSGHKNCLPKCRIRYAWQHHTWKHKAGMVGQGQAVITLLEYIKEYCMKRIVNVQGVFNSIVMSKCTGPLTPTATRIMESIKKEAHLMKVQWNGANKYQVSGSLGDQCVVDVVSMTCSCRKWELTGIPCKHAVAACWNMALNDLVPPPPETWVNPCYWLSTWKETYSHKIQPICGTNYWEKSTCPTTLLPPKHHVQVGRPKKKRKRSKHKDEPFVKDGKLSRKGRTITCQSCRNIGHNKATCKGQGRKATTGGNNAEGSGSASRKAQQTEPAVGQDGSGGSGVGAVLGLSAAGGEGGAGDPCGAGVASQVLVSQTRNADGREIGDGVPTQSSAAGGASEWFFL
ncbi:hypothetical protein Tco_0852705 [Tanacetum coccineum]